MTDGFPGFITNRTFLLDMVVKGKIEEAFDIFGNEVRFRTLDTDESLDALKETNGFDIMTKQSLLRNAILSRALVSINGDWVPSSDEAKTFLGKIPPVLVEEFWNNYEILRERRDDQIKRALIDLKKSSRNQNPGDTGDSANSPSPTGSARSIL